MGKPGQGKTAWVYIRESQEASASGHSPDTQERLCRELAEEMGLTIAHIAVEIKPAASMKKRPTWKQVERSALRGEFDALIVWEYSRIARNTTDWMHFVGRAVNAGVDVYSTNSQEKQVDWHSPMGRGMLAMIGSFNEMERETIRERSMQNKRTRVLKGMPPVGPKPPYGYRWVEGESITQLTGASRKRKLRLCEDAVEAARMRAIWDYFDTPNPTHTFGGCEHWLNLVQRWPAPEGGLWQKNTLRYLIFEQGYYWGEGEAFRTEMVPVRVSDPETGERDIETRQRPRPKAERLRVPVESVPPLISQAQKERVHAYLREKGHQRQYDTVTREVQPSKRQPRTWNPDDFLLMGGLLRCGICNHKLFLSIKSGGTRRGKHAQQATKRATYRCAAGARLPLGHADRHYLSIDAATADAFAVAQTLSLLLNQDEADAAFTRLGEQDKETDSELTVACAELARTDEALAAHRKLAEVLTTNEVAQFALTLRKLNETREKQAARVDELRGVKTRVQSLAAVLATAVKRAHETMQQFLAATAQDREGAEVAMWQELDQLLGLGTAAGQDGNGNGTSDGSSARFQVLAAQHAAAEEQQFESLLDFIKATREEQRQVMRALGVHVVLEKHPDLGVGPSGRRHFHTGVSRLRYVLPLDERRDNGKLTCINFMPPIRRHG